MATVGKPSLPRVKVDPRTGGVPQRSLDQLIDNIAERFRALEAQSTASAQETLSADIANLRTQLSALQRSVALLAAQVDAAVSLAASFESVSNGVLVKQGELVISRALLPGFGIDVQYQDGQDGDPTIIWRPDPEPAVTEMVVSGHAPEIRVGVMIDVPAGVLTATGEAPTVV